MKVTDNVIMLESTRDPITYRGKTMSSMVYAVVEEDGITLIDSGFPGVELKILEELRALGRGQLPLKQILLTHADHDHMGNAAWLQQKTGCKVYISETELEYTNGKRERLPQKQQLCADLGLKTPDVLTVYPAEGILGDFRIIATPGHTAGHVSLLYNGSVLFGGDLFVYRDGALETAMPLWSEDMDAAIRSLVGLTAWNCSVLCPAHFGPCKSRAALEEFVSSVG